MLDVWMENVAHAAGLLGLAVMPVLATAVMGWLLWKHERQISRQARHDLCAACDYDLRGLESGVCPECGTPRVAGVAN